MAVQIAYLHSTGILPGKARPGKEREDTAHGEKLGDHNLESKPDYSEISRG